MESFPTVIRADGMPIFKKQYQIPDFPKKKN